MRTGLPRLMAVAIMAVMLTATAADTSKKSMPKRIKTSTQLVEPREGLLAGYDQRPEVREFIRQMVDKHGFVASELATLFARTRFNPAVARLMTPATSTEPRSWTTYRGRFVEPNRIRAGARFWNENSAALTRATTLHGVPADIIVGIVGVETVYGRNTGTFRVIDALTTLAFDYPYKERDRSPYFREQLEDYLLFSRDGNLDVFEVLGSYAGAIGIPQFMPGSYRRYAIDFDGDDRIDLRGNPADAIGSVANYLREHGWVRGEKVFYTTRVPEQIDPVELKRLVDAGTVPSLRADALRKAGFVFDPAVPDEVVLALIDLVNEAEGSGGTEYVLGTMNFYALTRYNRSYFYAMAVTLLGAAVREQVGP